MTLRFQKLWWLAILLNQVSAISLLQVIQSRPELTTLAAYVNSTQGLLSFISNADNFTFLAPSNNAIGAFLSNNPNILTPDLLQATLQYSLLQGGYPKLSFTSTPQFAATNLTNGTYTNVTSSQHVELVLGSDGVTPQAISGNRSISTPSTTDLICTGGIIHIMNDVLNVPVQAVTEISNAGLQYSVSILSNGGYLSAQNADYVNSVLALPNVTYFIPNTQQALSDATAFAANSTPAELQWIFQHHIVSGFVGYSSLLKDGMVLGTANGANLSITVRDGDTYVNAAKIITPDYLVANGVIQVIDNLISNITTPPPVQSSAPSSSVGPATSTPTPSSSGLSSPLLAPTGKPDDDPDEDSRTSKSLSTGAIAGIAVGAGITGIAAVAAIAFWFFRRRRQVQSDQRNSIVASWSDHSNPSNPGAPWEKGTFHPSRPYRETPVPPPPVHIDIPDRGTSTPDVPHKSPKRLDQREFF